MAKRKNKKQSRQSANQKSVIQPASETPVAQPPAQSPTPKNKVSRTRTSASVGIGTCIAGMFLTLLLGLYLGSLVPDIRQKLDKPRAVSTSLTRPNVSESISEAAVPELPAESGRKTPEPPQSATQTPAPPPPAAQSPQSIIPGNIIPGPLASRIADLEQTLQANPRDGAAWIELGNAFFDTGQHTSAIHAYEHALEISPGNPDVLTDLGIMHRETGNYDKALECFRKASTIDPHHVNALFNEGVVLGTDLGRRDDGIAAWRKILVFAPGALTPGGRPLAQVIEEMR